jgi:transcriptional regulator with XRE-family HTH domain
MITNERQYRITKTEAKRFEKAIHAVEADTLGEGIDPDLHDALIDAMESQLDELREELQNYEALRSGKIRKRALTSLAELPTALIEGRIARGLTQKELAKRVGLPEQQIQRYEANQYAGASLERLQEIADAVGIRLKKTVEYDVRGEGSRRPVGATRTARRVKTRRSRTPTRAQTIKAATSKTRRARSTKSRATKSASSRPTTARRGSSTKGR